MAVSGLNPDGDIATQLHSWAMEEMHFHPQGKFLGSNLPSPDDLKGICRGAQQANLWQYIIKHVHSVQTVKKVRGNLQIKSKSSAQPYSVKYRSDKTYTDEHQALLDQRAGTLGEITTVLSEVQQLEREVGRISQDVQAAEREYQQSMESLRDLGRKTCLVNVYSTHCREATAQNVAYSSQIDEKTLALSKVLTDTSLHLRSEDEGSGGQGTTLESSATQRVRESCELTGKFLHQMLQGTFGSDKTKFRTSKEQLWKQVEDTLSDLDIRNVLGCLLQLSEQGAQAIRQHTLKMSIHEDAQKLRFKYEKGGLLRDVSTQPTALQSIQQLLEESQMRHVLRFVETQKHLNAVHTHAESLEKVRDKVNAALKRYLSKHPSDIQIASMLVQAKLDLAADTAAEACYRQEAESLKEKVAAGYRERDQLLTIHRRIQDFSELVNAKQNLIQVVAKQNAGAQSRLAAQKLEVRQYIMRSLLAHEMETQTLTAGLRGAVVTEAERFAALSLPYLIFLRIDSATKSGLLDLSIHHTSHPAAVPLRQPLLAVLAHLAFPDYKAAECITRHCFQLKREMEEERERAQTMQDRCQRVHLASGVQTSLDNISELCEKVKSQDKQELETLLPMLQNRISKAARASTQCIKVKDSVQAWWEQPAQFVTPWLTLDGLTYQQWYNKWRIIATNICQLYINK